MGTTPAGGAATVGGVVYQLLWSLLELTRFKVTHLRDDETGELESATLVLEPTGGGDARIESNTVFEVVQLKARSGGATWSLANVITDVLPDLLKAVRLKAPNPRYRFVTNGRVGAWQDVLMFFRSLRDLDEQQLQAALDLPGELRVGAHPRRQTDGKQPFWSHRAYTRRALIEKIVAVLGVQGGANDLERRVLHLLAHFEFEGSLTVKKIEARLDKTLIQVIDHNDDLRQTRLHLLQRVAEQCRLGNAEITLGSFLEQEGLGAVPTHDLAEIHRCCHRVLLERLLALGFDPHHHVQEAFTARLAQQVFERSVLVVTGNSGSGKSWHCCAVALRLRERAIDGDDDVSHAAQAAIWEDARARGVERLAEEAAAASGACRAVLLDHLAAGARGNKETPEVRPGAMKSVEAAVSASVFRQLDERLQRGRQDFQRGARGRDRRRGR